MSKVSDVQRMWLAMMVLVAANASAPGQEIPDLTTLPKYQAAVPYAGVRNWHVTQNLGPTGARGWIEGRSGDTTASRQILIKSVEPGSPADGLLQPYDVILGAAVPPNTSAARPFADDARLSLARAITWAESDQGQGKLKLLRHRDGQTQPVVIQLPVMGTYSSTAPYNCPKTKRIVNHAAAFLAEQMPGEGYFSLQGAMNAMLLYATGDERYLDHVRRSACRMSLNHTITDAGHETWRWGYMNLFLSEYYLATGDPRVLPTIQEFCDVLAAGQCNPGTWGHSGVPDFIPPGYGSMNQSGLVCFLSMALARQAGVEVDATALSRSIGFYGRYAGTGGIPYGDHAPANSATSNGKNGSAAVAFGVLGAEQASQWFARLCASADLRDFEGGHTGNFFNQTWSPLGASLAGRSNYQQFWSRFNSYRDLARRWDGSFVTQPWPHTREGDLGTGNYVYNGPLWTTGGYALSYLAGNGRLAILGRRDSVFGANPPAKLAPALQLYRQKKFAQCSAAAAHFIDATDVRLRTLAAQLQTAADRNRISLGHTLADMQKTLRAGDLYKLKWQLQAIESILDPSDPRLAPFRMAVEDPAHEPLLEVGADYHRNTAGVHRAGMHGFHFYAKRAQTDSKQRAQLAGWVKAGTQGYGELAKAFLAKYPEIQLTPNTPLFDPAMADSWHVLTEGQAPAAGWQLPGFDASAWRSTALPDKGVAGKGASHLRRVFDVADPTAVQRLGLQYRLEGRMRVYLNGELVVDVNGGGWPSDKALLLKPIAGQLLRAGKNCLAIELGPIKGDDQFTTTLTAVSR